MTTREQVLERRRLLETLPARDWISIHDQRPEEHQDVWYYFGVFDKIYAGKYCRNKDSYEDGGETIEFEMNCFYDRGFLNDDVTWWMPRDDVYPEPYMPTWQQKMMDYHIPDYLQIKINNTTIARMYDEIQKHQIPELGEAIDKILNDPRLPDCFYEDDEE